MIRFNKNPGVLVGPTPAKGSSWMIKANELNLVLTLDITYDRDSAPVVGNLISSFQDLFDEEQVGPNGRPLKLKSVRAKNPFAGREPSSKDDSDSEAIDAEFTGGQEQEPPRPSLLSKFWSLFRRSRDDQRRV